jgi:hypothetical protein
MEWEALACALWLPPVWPPWAWASTARSETAKVRATIKVVELVFMIEPFAKMMFVNYRI